jgi:hypothetical protein
MMDSEILIEICVKGSRSIFTQKQSSNDLRALLKKSHDELRL